MYDGPLLLNGRHDDAGHQDFILNSDAARAASALGLPMYLVKARSGEARDHECAGNVPLYHRFLAESKSSIRVGQAVITAQGQQFSLLGTGATHRNAMHWQQEEGISFRISQSTTFGVGDYLLLAVVEARMGQPIKYTNQIKCRFCHNTGFSSDHGQVARHYFVGVMATEARPIRDLIHSARTEVTSFCVQWQQRKRLKRSASRQTRRGRATTLVERVGLWVRFSFTPNPRSKLAVAGSLVRFHLELSAEHSSIEQLAVKVQIKKHNKHK